MERIIKIQQELKAPKGQYNDFGKYKYRSAEDILEAVKPLLAAEKLLLILTDDLVNTGDRYYVKAEALVCDETGKPIVSTSAFAREDETQKGKDGSQITGTASSYARKYALNGLFLIDDTKDADTNEFHNITTAHSAKEDPIEIVKEQVQKLDIKKPKGWDKMTRSDKEEEITGLCAIKALNLSTVLKEANVKEMADLEDTRLLGLFNYISTKK